MNTKGRDFAVGDIHGCFDLVQSALDAVKFDPAGDRLFCVGDYIDRGPDSSRVVPFLKNEWVYGVLGNHEVMLLDLYEHGDPGERAVRRACSSNGFDWWLNTPDSVRQDVLDAVKALPYVREVDTAQGTVGILHADVPSGWHWDEFVEAVMEEHPHVLHDAVWSREGWAEGDRSGIEGIGRIFVGHTPVRKVVAMGNIFPIDTGAVFSVTGQAPELRLTLADIAAPHDVLTREQFNSPVPLIDIRA
ncbi:metallophosphoesterase [Paraburkholderia sp. UCT31]|uniref:metallophosphoesterase n=1 Tax=Paraburkholderia sp. UCT31 TaxID=2615209 RepID=UPI001655C373|nr:metallophosphoesterase [Paraburkholderia sp. UCT31]